MVTTALVGNPGRRASLPSGKVWMSKLANIVMDHEGYLVDKWEHYLGIYDSELAPFIAAGRPISLLKIGLPQQRALGGPEPCGTRFAPHSGVSCDLRQSSLNFIRI